MGTSPSVPLNADMLRPAQNNATNPHSLAPSLPLTATETPPRDNTGVSRIEGSVRGDLLQENDARCRNAPPLAGVRGSRPETGAQSGLGKHTRLGSQQDNAGDGVGPPRKRGAGETQGGLFAPEEVGFDVLVVEVNDVNSHIGGTPGDIPTAAGADAEVAPATALSSGVIALSTLHAVFNAPVVASETEVAQAPLAPAESPALDPSSPFHADFERFPMPSSLDAVSSVPENIDIVSDRSATPSQSQVPVGPVSEDFVEQHFTTIASAAFIPTTPIPTLGAASTFAGVPTGCGPAPPSNATSVHAAPRLPVHVGVAGGSGSPPLEIPAEMAPTVQPPIPDPLTSLVEESSSSPCEPAMQGALNPPSCHYFLLPHHHLLHAGSVPVTAVYGPAPAIPAVGDISYPFVADQASVSAAGVVVSAPTTMLQPPLESVGMACEIDSEMSNPSLLSEFLLSADTSDLAGSSKNNGVLKARSRRKKFQNTENKNPRKHRNRPACTKAGCKRRPLFGVEGTRHAQFCSSHMEPGMINVLCRQCEIAGCTHQPSFGMVGSRPMRCASHKLEGTVNLSAPRCLFLRCNVVPSFGKRGGKPTFCAAHRQEGDIDLVTRRCHHEGCVRRPVFGYASEKKAYYCASHKLEGMVNVFAPCCKFPDCLHQPSWGIPGVKKPTHCAKHRAPQHKNKR